MHITEGINKLVKIYKKYPIEEVHLRSHETLSAISENKENLTFIFKWFIERYYDIFQNLSISGDFIIPLYGCNAFTLDGGIFSPFDTNYSYATMHNHDDVQLSTVNLFGSGYNSLIFQQGFTRLDNNEVNIEPEVYKTHTLGNIEFIDCNTAHTVFFPKDLTITLTLWSSSKSIGNNVTDWWYRVKKNYKSKQRKRQLYKVYGVKNLSYVLQDWFYPENGKIYTSPYYEQAAYGKNFLNNFFYKLQQINFEDKRFVENYFSKKKLSAKDQGIIHSYLNDVSFSIQHEGDQMITPKRNVHLDEYKKCFPEFEFFLS